MSEDEFDQLADGSWKYEIESLRAKVAELEADAARYRWLRENSYVAISATKQCLWIPKGVFEIPGKGFDAAIDAAMRNEK